MFTGLVEAVGTIEAIRPRGAGRRLEVRCGALAQEVEVGDSISVSGCCLTVVARDDERLAFDAVAETLALTWFGEAQVGERVNLERALRVGDRLGGHLVQGHVDGLAEIVAREHEPGGGARFRLRAERRLCRDMIHKGSVTLDGVSLTLTAVEPEAFEVALIPHTLAVTTFGVRRPGDRVHLETDLVGKWLRRIAAPYLEAHRG
ncbi:MAG: riboflavin synthase [Planctomycetota bacterium]|nr:MAG: riboflavin synthase [Planctomycetota bacterium]